MCDYDSYMLSRKQNMIYFLVCSTALAAGGYLFYHNLFFCMGLALLSIPGKQYYKSYLVQKRRKELSSQFRDLLYSLSASFSTSKPMKDALEEALPVLLLLYGENGMMYKEVAYMVRRMQESRDSEETLLLDLAERSRDQDIESFIDVYIICRKSGGNLMRVVSKTVTVLIDKLDISREIQKLTAQKRYESAIITAIPLLMLLFLQFASPDFLSVLYETLAGRILMTLALFGTIGAYFWSMKITKIDF